MTRRIQIVIGDITRLSADAIANANSSQIGLPEDALGNADALICRRGHTAHTYAAPLHEPCSDTAKGVQQSCTSRAAEAPSASCRKGKPEGRRPKRERNEERTNDMIRSTDISASYTCCIAEEGACSLRERCLRSLAFREGLADRTGSYSLQVVNLWNPSLGTGTDGCKLFRKTRRVQFARSFSRLYDNVPMLTN